MSVDLQEFLTKQRKRATGAVLGFAERQPWYGSMSDKQRSEYREKVLSAIATYNDAVQDVISTLDGNGGVYNDAALKMITDLHTALVPSPARERPLSENRGR